MEPGSPTAVQEGLFVQSDTRFITLGHPSYVWQRGLERRLQLIRRYVPLEERRILDVGCGIGTWLQRFLDFSPHVFGIEVDEDKGRVAVQSSSAVVVAPSEAVPFHNNSFDVVLLHEVIEHVRNDRETILEAVRCVRPGGHVVIFAPNRLYPFETHGFFLGNRFIFHQLPLVNYTPDFVRNRFCHHVRIYTRRGIRRLFRGLKVEFVVCSQVYPGLDNWARRSPSLGRVLQATAAFAERTPMRSFGISHFVVALKL